MARPRRSGATRAELLQLGTEFLGRKGYGGTGLKEVLDAAGAPKGSFYNYFASKEEYVAEVIDAYMDRLMVFHDQVVANASDAKPLERLLAVHRALIGVLDSQEWTRGCLLGSLASELGSQSEPCRRAFQRGFDGWRDRIEALLLEGQELGEVRADVPARELAGTFWASWQGALVRMQFETSGEGLAETLAVLIDHLLRAPSAADGRSLLPSTR